MTVDVDGSPPEIWEVPDSEASEDEDEYHWLRQRGFRLAHDYWPSRHREEIVSWVRKYCFSKEVSSHHAFTRQKLTLFRTP